MLQQHADLDQRVKDNVTQVWGNQEALKAGMDSAEFNLRAHQKVLNALAIELIELVNRLNDEHFKTEHTLKALEAGDTGVPSEHVVQRVDWEYYHREVEKDLEALSAAEESVAEEKREALELESKMKAMSDAAAELVQAAEDAGNDPDEVKTEYAALMSLTEKVSEALGNKLRGEEYDEVVLEEAQRLIDTVAGEGEPLQEDSIPAGASVFGG